MNDLPWVLLLAFCAMAGAVAGAVLHRVTGMHGQESGAVMEMCGVYACSCLAIPANHLIQRKGKRSR